MLRMILGPELNVPEVMNVGRSGVRIFRVRGERRLLDGVALLGPWRSNARGNFQRMMLLSAEANSWRVDRSSSM